MFLNLTLILVSWEGKIIFYEYARQNESRQEICFVVKVQCFNLLDTKYKERMAFP